MSATLGPRFVDALAWAIEHHGDQVRKGTGITYVSHLLSVAALVLEDGGDETEAVAALLHDTVEDTDATVSDVATRFGDGVATIVEACSDSTGHPKPPWRERKERYVAHLRDPSTPEAVLRVAGADKLHNARSILGDYRREGDALWARFNVDARTPAAHLWYYDELLTVFRERRPHSSLTAELGRVVADLHAELPPG